jgi:hypothetical protein
MEGDIAAETHLQVLGLLLRKIVFLWKSGIPAAYSVTQKY